MYHYRTQLVDDKGLLCTLGVTVVAGDTLCRDQLSVADDQNIEPDKIH